MAAPATTAQHPARDADLTTRREEASTRLQGNQGAGHDAFIEHFSAFFREQIKPLSGYLIRLGAGRETAADIVQETMMDAYKDWLRIDNPKSWVYTVARRKFGQQLKMKASTEILTGEFSEMEKMPEGASETDQFPMLETIREGIEKLSSRQAEVMMMTFLGYETEEISEMMGIQKATVRSMRRTARNALIRMLPEIHSGSEDN
ncbi:RNA polymerase sigma factor [Streptomyces cyaneofuscatus]|uniref:RNA polymerase sigma factor n=1 Tax=Streptomyces cyaneofuscatus TaxID=66883 RepID=UPI003333B897